MNSVTINIYNIVGSSFCIEAEAGDKVFSQIKKAMVENKNIIVSFTNVEMITSAFLNNAIGKLYGEFDENKIKEKLSVEDMLVEDKILLKRVTSTAKLYYKDPEGMQLIVNDEENILTNYCAGQFCKSLESLSNILLKKRI